MAPEVRGNLGIRTPPDPIHGRAGPFPHGCFLMLGRGLMSEVATAAGHAPRTRSSVRRVALRAASFVVSFAIIATIVWRAGAQVVRLSGVPRPNMTLDLIPRLQFWRNELRHAHSRLRVALMGDSMVFTEWPGRSMPEWVKRELSSQHGPARHSSLHVLSWPAWGTAPEYCMVDEVAKARPDLLVLELNLRLLGPAPLGSVSYTELAGHIGNRRLAEASLLPLSHAGITLSRLLFYRLVVLMEHERHFGDVLMRQAMLFNARGPLEEWIDGETKGRQYTDRRWAWGIAMSGRQLEHGMPRPRDNRAHALDSLGDVIEGIGENHPRLVVLGAMLSDFRKQGIPVLVWVSPINVEHLRTLGLPTDGIDRSMVTIGKLVEQSGARFLDLHELLPDEAFVDAGDHYTRDGAPNGSRVVGQELGRVIALEEERLALQ